MSRKKIIKLCLISFIITIAVFQATGDCSEGIQKVTYSKWKNSYRLYNNNVELIVVPSIGRAMVFRKTDGKNVFHIYDEYNGKTRKKTDDYIGFGGLYTWLAPQTGWSLTNAQKNADSGDMAAAPLDGLAHKVINIDDRSITISNYDKENYKILIEKTYVVDEKLPRFTYSVKMTNKSNVTVRWSVWNLTAVPYAGDVVFKASEKQDSIRFFRTGRSKKF